MEIKFTERIADAIYGRLEKMRNRPDKLLYDSNVRDALQTLEPAGDTQKRQKEYVIKKLSVCVLVVICGVGFSLVQLIKEETKEGLVDNRIERNEYGNGEKSVSLVAEGESDTYEIDLSLEERVYSDEEIEALFNEFLPLLEKKAMGENESFDKVEYDLSLVSKVSGYPFSVDWSTDGKLVAEDGALINNILAEPEIVTLTAEISYEDFRVQQIFNCMVYSKAIQPTQSELLSEELEKTQSETKKDSYMILPSKLNGEEISWHYKKSYMGLLFLFATPVIAIVIYVGTDRDLRQQVEDRNEQLKADYPEIVSSIALLIGAGMTVPNAWKRVVGDYRAEKKETGAKKYAYEEMLIAVYEMDSGVAQTNAYERFGRRCKLQAYNKLATMLSQNVTKGATDLAALLKEEAEYAFEERKHSARQLGEKAGTKLLMPMMMLLGMVMVVVMVPAFMSYF